MGNRGRPRHDGISRIKMKIEEPQKFICDICNTELPNNHKLLSHKRRHKIAVLNYDEDSDDKDEAKRFEDIRVKATQEDGYFEFPCGECGKILNTKKGLILHGVKVHNRQSVETPEKNSLTENLKTILVENSLPTIPCEKCGKLFHSKKAVSMHLLVHRREDSLMKRVFVDSKIDTEDFAMKNLPIIKPQCAHCSKHFSTAGFLKAHLRKYHETEEKTIVALEMENGKKLYQCKQCVYCTKFLPNLQKHELSHLSTEERKKLEKRRQCHLCSHSTRASNLSNHLAMKHNVGKPRLCPMCNFQTINPNTLKSHLKNVHDKVNKLSTTCLKCLTTFESGHALRRHKWEQMGKKQSCSNKSNPSIIKPNLKNDIPTPDIKPFVKNDELLENTKQKPIDFESLHKCHLCRKVFATKSFLNKHFNHAHPESVSKDPSELYSIKSEDVVGNLTNFFDIKEEVVIQDIKEEIKDNHTESNSEEIQIKVEEIQDRKDSILGGLIPKVQRHKSFFTTDRPDLQCDFCFVSCWDEIALANHMKRHRL